MITELIALVLSDTKVFLFVCFLYYISIII